MFSRLIFSIVDFGARKELSTPLAPGPDNDGEPSAKQRARRTGVRGETCAYAWRANFLAAARSKARNVVSMFSQSKRSPAQNLARVCTKARSTPTGIHSSS
jgi:hypothetical protein